MIAFVYIALAIAFLYTFLLLHLSYDDLSVFR